MKLYPSLEDGDKKGHEASNGMSEWWILWHGKRLIDQSNGFMAAHRKNNPIITAVAVCQGQDDHKTHKASYHNTKMLLFLFPFMLIIQNNLWGKSWKVDFFEVMLSHMYPHNCNVCMCARVHVWQRGSAKIPWKFHSSASHPVSPLQGQVNSGSAHFWLSQMIGGSVCGHGLVVHCDT